MTGRRAPDPRARLLLALIAPLVIMPLLFRRSVTPAEMEGLIALVHRGTTTATPSSR